jgi:hypothetical protein
MAALIAILDAIAISRDLRSMFAHHNFVKRQWKAPELDLALSMT